MRLIPSRLAAFVLAATPLAAQTVDEIVARNIAARGGLEKLRAVQSLRLTGTMTLGPGLSAPLTMELKRPASMRVEFTYQGMTGVQAFDGKTAWMTLPFIGQKEPALLTPDETQQVADQADIDGPLVDSQAKGYRVELVGRERLEGTEAWKLKITRASADPRFLYLAADSYLQVREEGRRVLQGTEMDVVNVIGDYRPEGEILMPHSIESGAKGSPEKQKLSFAKVELNVPLDESRFRLPEGKKPEPPRPQ